MSSNQTGFTRKVEKKDISRKSSDKKDAHIGSTCPRSHLGQNFPCRQTRVRQFNMWGDRGQSSQRIRRRLIFKNNERNEEEKRSCMKNPGKMIKIGDSKVPNKRKLSLDRINIISNEKYEGRKNSQRKPAHLATQIKRKKRFFDQEQDQALQKLKNKAQQFTILKIDCSEGCNQSWLKEARKVEQGTRVVHDILQQLFKDRLEKYSQADHIKEQKQQKRQQKTQNQQIKQISSPILILWAACIISILVILLGSLK